MAFGSPKPRPAGRTTDSTPAFACQRTTPLPLSSMPAVAAREIGEEDAVESSRGGSQLDPLDAADAEAGTASTAADAARTAMRADVGMRADVPNRTDGAGCGTRRSLPLRRV